MTIYQSVTTSTRKTLEEVQAKLQSVTFSDVEYQAEKLIRKLMGRPNHCSTLANYVTGKDSEGYDFGRQKSFKFRVIPEERGYPNSVLYDYIITSGGSITKKADDPYAVTILNDLYYILRENEDIVLPPDCYSSSLIYEAIKREMFDLPLPDPKAHLLTPSMYEPHDLWKILRREQKWSDLKAIKEEVETTAVTARKCARMIYEILSADKDTILKWKEVCGFERSPPSTSVEVQRGNQEAEGAPSSPSSSSASSGRNLPLARIDNDPVSQAERDGIGMEEIEEVPAAVSPSPENEGTFKNDNNDRATTRTTSIHSQGGEPRPRPLSKMNVARKGSIENSTAISGATRSSMASLDEVQVETPIPEEEDEDEDVLPLISTSFNLSTSTNSKFKCLDQTATTTSTHGGDPHHQHQPLSDGYSIPVEEVQGQGQVSISNPDEKGEDDFASPPTSTSCSYSRTSKCLDQNEILSMLMILDDESNTNAGAAAEIEIMSPEKAIHRQESKRSVDDNGVSRSSSSSSPKGGHLRSQCSPEIIMTTSTTRKRRINDNGNYDRNHYQVKADAATARSSDSVDVSNEDEENEEQLFVPVSPVFTPTFYFSDWDNRYPISPSPEKIIPSKRKKPNEKEEVEVNNSSAIPTKELPGKLLELSSIINTPEGQGQRRLVQVTPKNTVKPQKRKSAEMNSKILELSSIMNTPEEGQRRQVQIGRVAPRRKNAFALPEPLASSTPNISGRRPITFDDTSGANGNADVEHGFCHGQGRGTPVSVRLPVKLVPRAIAGPGASKAKSTPTPPPVPVPDARTRYKDSSQSQMEDVQFSEEDGWKKDEKSLRKSKRTWKCTILTGKKENFTKEEEYLIVQKICEAKAFLLTGKQHLYKDMAKTKEFMGRRTYISLYDRFRKFIGPKLERFVDDNDGREIRKFAKKCGISAGDMHELLNGLEVSNMSKKCREFFSEEEDYLIVRKMCEGKAFRYTGRFNLYKDMAKSKDFAGRRTAFALRHRFRLYIQPKLQDEKERKKFTKKCGISSEDLKELLEGLEVSANKRGIVAPRFEFD